MQTPNRQQQHYLKTTSIGGNAKNIRKRFLSRERSNNNAVASDQLQFLSCDDVSLVVSNEHNQSIAGVGSSCGDEMMIPPISPTNDNQGEHKIRRRKLNWRVGPLQKRRRPKQQRQQQQQQKSISNKSSSGSFSDGMSIAERTVRSYHTFHSTETVKVGNNGQKGQKLPSRQNRQYYPSPKSSSSKTTLTSLTPPRTPKQTIVGSYYYFQPTTPSTIGSTPGGGLEERDKDDDGSIIASLEESTQLEENNRTIGLFNSGSKEIFSSTLPIENTSSRSGSSRSLTSNSVNEKSKVSKLRPAAKGTGLPPRSTFVPTTLTYEHAINPTKNDKEANKDFSDDDDSESNESGGPLWQLAKLHAISEGPISASPQSSSSNNSKSTHTSNMNEEVNKYVSLSSNGSVSSNQTSSTDPQEIQMIQAERNLKAIHALAQQHLKFGEIPEAINVLEEMLRGVKQLHGEYHHRVGTVLHNISTVYIKAGMYRKAITHCLQAVNVRRKTLGSFHSDLACSLTTLGLAQLEVEEYQDAISNFKRAMIIRRKTLSYNDPKIARLLNNIGCALYNAGNLEEAERSFELALSTQKIIMQGSKGHDKGGTGRDASIHSDNILLGIASTLCNLASLRAKYKKYDEAVAALDEALLLQQSILGDEHPKVISTKAIIDQINKARSHTNNVYRSLKVLTESLKELNLNDKAGVPPNPCRAPDLKTSSLRNLMADVMSVDWGEAFLGPYKLCSMDTTTEQSAFFCHDDARDINSSSSAYEESYHDFYLI